MRLRRLHRLIIRPEAEADVQEAALWYQARERGHGHEFLRAFKAAAAKIRRNPRLYPIVIDRSRRALFRRFPYAVIYEIHRSEIVILACIHCARDPETWRQRLPRRRES